MTLAETKAELGHLEALIIAHPEGCPPCRYAGRSRSRWCDEQKALRAQASEMRKEIRTWFAPGRDDATLFDGEA